jgi:hypothetical protein
VIISGGSRCNWRFFAKHLMNPDTNELVRIAEIRGLAADNLLDAFREMDALASGTRCKNFFYHADINPREDEHLTDDQWEKAVDTLEANLGLVDHSRFIVDHEKNGRTHRHVVWSRIDVDSMTAVSDSKNYASHEKTSRELEQAFGHEPVRGAHGRDGGKRPERRPDNWEVFRGKRSGIDPQEVKAELTALWRQADTGPAFVAAIDQQGYVFARGDKRDFVVVDQAGDAHSLARRIDGAKAADIRARLAGIDREALPTVEEARALAKERAAQRQAREEVQQPDDSLPADPAPKKRERLPFGELAEELVHAVKDAFRKKEPSAAELSPALADALKPEASLFERFAENLAKGSRQSLPALEALAASAALVEGEHVAKELIQAKKEPGPGAPSAQEPTAFDRVAQDWKQATRDAEGEGLFIAEGIDWLAGKVKHPPAADPPAGRELSPFERVASETKQAVRDNGGEPYTTDGQSFWRRSVDQLTEAIGQAVAWARDRFRNFVGRLQQDRNNTREHEPDFR